jgi:PKD repeat protein
MQKEIIIVLICGLMILGNTSNIEVTNSEDEVERAIMWYGWESRLVCVQVSIDGLTADFTESPLIQENGDPMPSTAFLSLTMLEDGSLLFATETGSTKPFVSRLFHIQDPQCDGTTSYAKFLGIMPDDIGIEALYTDALGRIYIMDTGQQHSSTTGNRLLRFTGDVVMGDFAYEVVGPSHSVPDMDGLGPGIDKTTGWVVDTPGFGIDSYDFYDVDYETGTYSLIGTTVGPYAIHAINGSFFSDGKSRLYTITGIPQIGQTSSTLYEIDPDTGATLRNLGSGPSGTGLTGSLAKDPGEDPDENIAPVADAGLDQSVNEGNTVQFDGSASYDLDGTIVSYEWDFGDGSPLEAGVNPTHIYNTPGNYMVTLTVTDNDNASDSDTCTITVLAVIQPPNADAGADQMVNEGDVVEFNGNGSFDPDGNITSYRWDFDSSADSDGDGNPSNDIDAEGLTPTYVYGDDGEFIVTLRVTDNENLSATDICNITVQNVNPTVTIKSAIMDVEIGLRVAGRKYNNVSMSLYEDDTEIGQVSIERLPGSPNEQMAWEIGQVSIERLPGSPNEQMAWIPHILDMTKSYFATVTYEPEDPPNIGGNPVWIYVKFENGNIKKIHHTFNVQQSKKKDSEHWNHIEPWEVDLNAHLIGCSFEVTYHITDPGSDDENLTFIYGSQNVTVTYLNNPPNPDPFPSPEIKPVDINDTANLTYEGPGTVVLQIEDDDGGTNSTTIDIS